VELDIERIGPIEAPWEALHENDHFRRQYPKMETIVQERCHSSKNNTQKEGSVITKENLSARNL